MKLWVLLITLAFNTSLIFAQIDEVSYTDEEKTNLVQIAETFADDVIFFDDVAKDKLTPHLDGKFSRVAKTMMAYLSDDESMLTIEFLQKPSYEDLVAWTVIYGVFNNFSDTVPNLSILEATLNDYPTKNTALNNYYECIKGKFSNLMNTNDLSNYNFKYDTLNLETEEEQVIFMLNIISACTQRFQILQFLEKFPEIQEMTGHLPTFNGQPYHTYTNFDHEDFLIIIDGAGESYNSRYMNLLYNSLMAHFTSIARTVSKKDGYKFYNSSILSKPKYFPYSSSQDILQQIYDSLNKEKED
jgi:hypothetical protein